MKLELILFITGLVVIAEAVVTTNVSVKVGETALLVCTVPVEARRKEWKSEKRGVISVNSEVKYTSRKFQLVDAYQSADYSLKILNLSLADADTYTCTGRGYKYIVNLTVGAPPSFDGHRAKTVTRSLNQQVILVCDAKGTAPFQKQWYRTDGGMKREMSAGISDNGNELHLSAQWSPSEEAYECLVENMFGSASITYNVQPTARRVTDSERKTEKVTSQKPKPTLYVYSSSKTTTLSAVKQTEMVEPTTKKARSGRAQMASTCTQTKPQNIMTITSFFVMCYFGATRVL